MLRAGRSHNHRVQPEIEQVVKILETHRVRRMLRRCHEHFLNWIRNRNNVGHTGPLYGRKPVCADPTKSQKSQSRPLRDCRCDLRRC